MHVYEWLCLCLHVCGGATLETLSLSLRPRDGGLVPAWYHICYIYDRFRDGGLIPA